MDQRLRILYIFTSGHFDSANNKKWFDLLAGDKRYEILILIQDCDKNKKEEFENRYGNFFQILYFKSLPDLLKLNYLQRYHYLKEIAKEIDKFKPEIIHLHGLFYTYMAIPVFLLKVKPKLIFNIWGSDYNFAYKNKLKNKILFKRLIKKASLIWVNWFALEQQLKMEFPQYAHKIKTILWGVENELFESPTEMTRKKIREKFNIKPEDYIFVYARAFNKNSNHLNILKAVMQLDPQKNFKFIFHNRNMNADNFQSVMSFVKQHHLKEKVLLSTKSLNFEEMKALYAEADVVLSLTTQEQLSRTTFEAILSDSHLIVNKNPSYTFLKQVFDFNIHMVDVGDIQSLTETFQYYIETRPAVDWRYEKVIIQRLFRFDAKKDKYFGIYMNLIKGKGNIA